MNQEFQAAIDALNHPDRQTRLDSLRTLKAAIDAGHLPKVEKSNQCNNHIHSQYSFSPYSPTKAVWMAYQAGLCTAGIVDHESVAGCLEFVEAGKIMDLTTTLGFEVRMNWNHTPLKGKMFNNPDQLSTGYFPIHGVPISALEKVEEFLLPIRKARTERNRAMTKKAADVLKKYGMELDFDQHVVPVSKLPEKGSITERHILYAAGLQMIEKFGRCAALPEFLHQSLGMNLAPKMQGYLSDPENPFYDFDLMAVLKGFFSEFMYIPADERETGDVRDVIPYLNSLGCVSTYTYLGDIKGECVTGDKKPQKFEDDILDDLFQLTHEYGMQAMSYAATRNTPDQIARVRGLCAKWNMLEVSGEDINQPRQKLRSEVLDGGVAEHLNDSTWALIGHEKMANLSLEKGMFSKKVMEEHPDIQERIEIYKKIGQEK